MNEMQMKCVQSKTRGFRVRLLKLLLILITLRATTTLAEGYITPDYPPVCQQSTMEHKFVYAELVDLPVIKLSGANENTISSESMKAMKLISMNNGTAGANAPI